MNKELLQNTFYLIAEYHLEEFECFISIGDNEEEIIQEFKKRYKKNLKSIRGGRIMSNAVTITLIICVTLIVITLIGRRK